MITEKEKRMAENLNESLKTGGIPVDAYSIITEIPFDGFFLYKEHGEWVVAAASRGNLYQTFGRFPKMFYAALFFIDMIAPFNNNEIQNIFRRLLRENVSEFENV